MYTVLAETEFRSSHSLRLIDGGQEPPHEHLWRITAAVHCRQLDAVQMGMDFYELKALLEECIRPFVGRRLEQQEAFSAINPTAESVARVIYDRLAPKLPPSQTLAWTEVTEAPGCRVRYRPD
jgi:6-pyruvoyltetrahydropterin/6-carboxytetrahydropterin synthase